jgi:hypothetical protein
MIREIPFQELEGNRRSVVAQRSPTALAAAGVRQPGSLAFIADILAGGRPPTLALPETQPFHHRDRLTEQLVASRVKFSDHFRNPEPATLTAQKPLSLHARDCERPNPATERPYV